MFTEFDSYLFHQGTLYDAYKKLGAHPCVEDGKAGVRFAVWAEHAIKVSVAIFDAYSDGKIVRMDKTEHGIWEVFVPDVQQGTCYKYLIDGADGITRFKADPYAFYSELRPANGSLVWGLNEYAWTDSAYMTELRPGIHDENLQVSAPEEMPRRLADKIRDIQEREAAYIYKKAMDDAQWYTTEKLMAERKEQEKKNEEAAAAKTPAKAKTLTEEEQKKQEKKLQENKEKEEKLWQDKISKAVKKAQEGITYVPPKAYHDLSSEEKIVLINRAAAELTREKPMSIYEVHLGSWKKNYDLNQDGFLNYRQLADELADYVEYMGFTHVEIMGICEYPFDGSWGYQVTGYFSPSSRHGNPEDLKYFIDKMHSRGIGVIIDWVPAHFPKDAFGLDNFDGSPAYESEDPLLAEYPEWGTKAFDHSRPEVRSFLISSAFYWIREFHADALRVDAVAAMIYTNFSRSQWRPNKFGGTLNLDSIAFMKQLNKEVIERTGAFLIAEDSSAEQGITKQVYEGGMGFMYKWNMGWMNDTLYYYGKDPVYRRYHFDQLTHTTDYVYTEYFINVLSHDEVVHLKKPMLYKMPGAIPDKLSGLKNLYTYQFTHPGKKLLFMGQEFAEDREWDENRIINWAYTSDTWHRDVLLCVKNLLAIYKEYPVLYKDSDDSRTLEWVNRKDGERGIMTYIRRNPDNYDGALLVILNTTPVQYNAYSCGVPKEGYCKRIFSTYDTTPGTGETSEEIPPLTAVKDTCDGYDYRLTYDLRPNEAVIVAL
ncbi:MAG: 1,4-alpha-glucan branching protein GlgB [Parasporobacterium sp.]|nr:1,4-alpha-glucan branching protein GlgB [Parasporobacterium sp.]